MVILDKIEDLRYNVLGKKPYGGKGWCAASLVFDGGEVPGDKKRLSISFLVVSRPMCGLGSHVLGLVGRLQYDHFF